MKIVEITPLGKGLQKMMMDDGFSCRLYDKEIRLLGLCQEEELSLEQEEKLRILLYQRGLKRSAYLLEKQDRSRGDIEEKLRRSGYPQEVIEKILSKLSQWQLIDDLAYAKEYVHQYGSRKSILQIKDFLYRKRISREYIDQALLELESEAQNNLLDELITKRIRKAASFDEKEKYKVFRYVLSKGFSYEDVSAHLNTKWEEAKQEEETSIF